MPDDDKDLFMNVLTKYSFPLSSQEIYDNAIPTAEYLEYEIEEIE